MKLFFIISQCLEHSLIESNLSPYFSLEHTSLCDKTQIGKYKIITKDKCPSKSEVRYFTYMKYKGCESKVVILFEVDENDPRWSDRRGIYTAMSRAMHNLIILQK